jgi:hypothetical protein
MGRKFGQMVPHKVAQKVTQKVTQTVKMRISVSEQIKQHATTAKRFELEWATVTAPTPALNGRRSSFQALNLNSERPCIDSDSQKQVVRELYPRLLYTFSDVVCFITNQPK